MNQSFLSKKYISAYTSALTAALAISGAALLVVDAASAQPAERARPPIMDSARMDKMVENRVQHLAKEIKATPEQKEKLLAIAKAAQADIKPQREQIKARMDSAMAEAREVMTPEQRTIWDKKMKSRQDWMERHANHRMKKHD